MTEVETDYIFRAMHLDRENSDAGGSDGINALGYSVEEFTHENMLQILEESEGYSNPKQTNDPNWTLYADDTLIFAQNDSIILVADADSFNLSDNNYQQGRALYVETVPWELMEEVIVPEEYGETAEELLSEHAQQNRFSITKAEDTVKYLEDNYTEPT
ncbi:MAG: hypothetical protein ABEK16_04435 [Candidatus Nanohalobium sp.]